MGCTVLAEQSEKHAQANTLLLEAVLEIREGDAVKRVIAASSAQAIYAPADQAADFSGTDFSTLDITVYQLSRAFGRGTGRSATLHV